MEGKFSKRRCTIIDPITVFIVIAACVLGAGAGYFGRKNIAETKIGKAEEQARQIVAEAEKAGDAKKKELLVEAKEEIHRMRSDMERENKERRAELAKSERRLVQRKKMSTARWMPMRKGRKTFGTKQPSARIPRTCRCPLYQTGRGTRTNFGTDQ